MTDPARALPVRPPEPTHRILLATDLSAWSDDATARALELAAELRAELLVVSVIEPIAARLAPTRSISRRPHRVDQVRTVRELAAQEIVKRGRSLGVRVSFLIWQGEAGESIIEAARAEGADLIVVGSRGRGPLGRWLLGSVSEHVVRNARCPVMVVPSGAGRATLEDGPFGTSAEPGQNPE